MMLRWRFFVGSRAANAALGSTGRGFAFGM